MASCKSSTCDLEIAFAHKSFAWESEAPGQATVTVVIIGLEKKQHARKDKVLFFYEDTKGKPTAEPASAISPYLFDTSQSASPNVVVKETSRPLNGLPKMMIGTQPIDDGQLIFKTAERDEFLKDEPKAARFMKPLIGAHEFLNSRKRYILDLAKEPPRVLRKMPHIMERLQKVTQFREKSKRKSTLAIANNPAQFNITAIPESPFLIIPRVSSDNREYIPIGYAKPPAIPTDAVLYIEGENTLCILAVLTSAMHMAWMRTVTGRLGNGYRYSIGVVYNTFPLPKGKELSKLAPLGQAILDARITARKKDPKATLADLYDPIVMPAALRRAHKANDDAVDKLYSPKPFADDTARINHLFALYEKQTAQ